MPDFRHRAILSSYILFNTLYTVHLGQLSGSHIFLVLIPYSKNIVLVLIMGERSAAWLGWLVRQVLFSEAGKSTKGQHDPGSFV